MITMKLTIQQQQDDSRFYDILCGDEKLLVVDKVGDWSMDCMPYEPVNIDFKYNLRLCQQEAVIMLLVSQFEHNRNYVKPQQNHWSIKHRAWCYSADEQRWTLAWKVYLNGRGDAYDEQCPELGNLLNKAEMMEEVIGFHGS